MERAEYAFRPEDSKQKGFRLMKSFDAARIKRTLTAMLLVFVLSLSTAFAEGEAQGQAAGAGGTATTETQVQTADAAVETQQKSRIIKRGKNYYYKN